MNMFLHELKAMSKSIAIWTASLIALAAIFLLIYPSMASDAADFKKLLAGYPAPVRAMLGINLDYITSILGFYSMIFTFIALCGAIQAANIGVSLLSKESRERTADFLLVKPVSRFSIVSAKLLAAFTSIVITNIIFSIAAFFIADSVKVVNFDVSRFFMINITLFFIQLIFAALGILISVFFNKLKSVLSISLGMVFGLYMVGTLITTNNNNDIARFISPFKYFNIAYIIKNGRYEPQYIIAGAVVIIVSIIISYMVYINKDIHAVS